MISLMLSSSVGKNETYLYEYIQICGKTNKEKRINIQNLLVITEKRVGIALCQG